MTEKKCRCCRKRFMAKSYLAKKGQANYCSSDCYHKDSVNKYASGEYKIWNKGKRGEYFFKRTGVTILCAACEKPKYFEQNQLRKRPCKYCSVKCARRATRKKVLTVYSSLHSRIRVLWGSASKCEKCGTTNDKTIIDWASINHTYTQNRKDWKMLCRKCHIAYDKRNKIRK